MGENFTAFAGHLMLCNRNRTVANAGPALFAIPRAWSPRTTPAIAAAPPIRGSTVGRHVFLTRYPSPGRQRRSIDIGLVADHALPGGARSWVMWLRNGAVQVTVLPAAYAHAPLPGLLAQDEESVIHGIRRGRPDTP